MFLILSLLGCSRLLTIQIEETATTTVEAGSILEDLLGDLGFSDFVSMDITAAEELQNQGIGPGDLVSVRVVQFDLEALTDGTDLSFLDAMAITAEAPELDQVQIASQTEFPEGQSLVEMNLDDTELVAYAESQSMSLGTEVTAKRPSEDTEVEAYVVIEIEATVQGALAQVR